MKIEISNDEAYLLIGLLKLEYDKLANVWTDSFEASAKEVKELMEKVITEVHNG